MAAKCFTKGCELESAECCVNAGLMYKKGDGVPQDLKLSYQFQEKARDLFDQMTKTRDRIKFQEGVETAGGAELKH